MNNSLKPPPTTTRAASKPASFPAPNSIQRSGRKGKVALQPGYSPLDWARLKSSGKNLRGIDDPSLIKVNREELSKHNKEDDAWTVLQGKVYNITPYVHFHPGGAAEIMKAAGKDGTKLFMYYHSWVNFEHMLDKCLVGLYLP